MRQHLIVINRKPYVSKSKIKEWVKKTLDFFKTLSPIQINSEFVSKML